MMERSIYTTENEVNEKRVQDYYTSKSAYFRDYREEVEGFTTNPELRVEFLRLYDLMHAVKLEQHYEEAPHQANSKFIEPSHRKLYSSELRKSLNTISTQTSEEFPDKINFIVEQSQSTLTKEIRGRVLKVTKKLEELTK